MKKLLVIPFLAVMLFTACKKKDGTVSQLVTYSTPTVTITGAQYYSIPVNGALPTISATAYDSFYKTAYPVVIDKSTLDNTTPGLYVVYATAKNKYGMVGSVGVYVAVTDISSAIHLEGAYKRVSNGIDVNLTRRANGLYETDNSGGVNPATSAAYVINTLFVQVDDTTMSFPTQMTTQGAVYGTNTRIDMIPADTTYRYSLNNSAYSTTQRVFLKQ